MKRRLRLKWKRLNYLIIQRKAATAVSKTSVMLTINHSKVIKACTLANIQQGVHRSV